MANVFFNAEYYLANNADLIRAGFSADNPDALWNHYVQYGAQETTIVDSLRVGPNPWFDVNYYLAANPDLNAAGLTAGDALVHYATYGINEANREFSSTVSIADFDAVTYAEKNKDLREAFGIEADFEELTEEQEQSLLTHYLAYGYAEEREGAGDIAKEIAALSEIEVDADGAIGTIGNDTFVTTEDVADGVIDGLGGDDTVVFQQAQTDTKIQNIEKVVVDTNDAVVFTSKQLLNKITLGAEATTVTANFAANAVAGSADVLNVVSNSADANAALKVNGIETVNLELGEDVTDFSLQSDKTKGDTFTVNVSGAAEGADLTVENENSPTVKNFVLDGSASTGGLGKITLGEQLSNVTNVTVTGSAAAKNGFDVDWDGAATVDTTYSLTLVGGDKVDTFTATDAIDTFTGGKGNDVFTFATGTSLVRVESDKVVGVDTITDFKKGDSVTGLTFTASSILTATGTIIETEDEFNAFLESGNANNVFQYGDDAYILVADNADLAQVELVKLAGVNVDDLKVATANDTGYTVGDLIFA